MFQEFSTEDISTGLARWSSILPHSQSSSNIMATRPSALGMSDPVMEFLEFHEKGKIFWVRGGRF